jgi:hypothetical protein
MSTPSAPPATDLGQDLDAAHRAHVAATTPRTASGPVDELTFVGQLSFLVTVGYLTKDQAAALIAWFNSGGMTPPPPIGGPDGIIGPSMYEILSTAIHFGLPTATDSGTHGLLASIGSMLDTAISAATDALQSALPTGPVSSAVVGFLQSLFGSS